MADYVTLAEIKSALNIPAADTTADTALSAAITAACASIDTTCGRTFALADSATTRVFRASRHVICTDDGPRLLIDDIGSEDGLAVEMDGSPVLDFEPGPDNAITLGQPITSLLLPSGVWGPGRITVTARWGWPAVPADIKQAARIQTLRLYRRKDSPEGVTGSAEWGVVRLSRRDPDVWALIEHYQAAGFG